MAEKWNLCDGVMFCPKCRSGFSTDTMMFGEVGRRLMFGITVEDMKLEYCPVCGKKLGGANDG